MLLHSGRAHWIQTGQPRHRQRPAHGTADDVTPGAVGQRPEDAISVIVTGPSTYNHMVVRLAAPANNHADLQICSSPLTATLEGRTRPPTTAVRPTPTRRPNNEKGTTP